MNLGEGFEIAVDELFGLVARDFQSLSKSKYGNTVDDAEVGAFGLRALIATHLVDGFLVDVGSGGSVDVVAVLESAYHVLVF